MKWNHNIHYHDDVLSAIPAQCRRALDVGCGRGALAQKLAERCQEVVAIDIDQESLAAAKTSLKGVSNLTFVRGDVLGGSLPDHSFDFVVAIAALHHLPLCAALIRLRSLLTSGGVLAVVGLFRPSTPIDYALAASAFPISKAIRLMRGEEEVGAPMSQPAETLADIRRECETALPGVVVRRRLFFRYTFVWQKPLIG